MKQRQAWLKGLSLTMIAAAVGLTGCSSGSKPAQSSTQPQTTAKTATAAPASDKAVKLTDHVVGNTGTS
ncbi:putative lipoprotein YmbA [Paenibacillus sp. V4I9]|uniref:hypothetical protein n=1 Tax=Paenibacillus sp. V4I9 TaxID=3042308 RepID=UPI002781D084|nr:hypothetical protein [Paenibacillus sp. V4I9]MDQ0885229.1 putative lipoprotein YmbA [Paenibacillus sp. V4I9]